MVIIAISFQDTIEDDFEHYIFVNSNTNLVINLVLRYVMMKCILRILRVYVIGRVARPVGKPTRTW